MRRRWLPQVDHRYERDIPQFRGVNGMEEFGISSDHTVYKNSKKMIIKAGTVLNFQLFPAIYNSQKG